MRLSGARFYLSGIASHGAKRTSNHLAAGHGQANEKSAFFFVGDGGIERMSGTVAGDQWFDTAGACAATSHWFLSSSRFLLGREASDWDRGCADRRFIAQRITICGSGRLRAKSIEASHGQRACGGHAIDSEPTEPSRAGQRSRRQDGCWRGSGFSNPQRIGPGSLACRSSFHSRRDIARDKRFAERPGWIDGNRPQCPVAQADATLIHRIEQDYTD